MNHSQDPQYSVLMPLAPWEEPHIVREALASLESQSLAPAQLVISCDGCLPERLLAVVEETSLPLEQVVGPGGEGVGPVLARGVLRCAHELVLRADADDLSRPQRARQLISAMLADPSLTVVGSWIDEFTSSADQVVAQRQVPLGAQAITCESRCRNPFNHPSVMFRRSAVLLVGNYRNRPGFEDYDLWLRILRRGLACANLAQSLVAVRVGASHLRRRHGWSYAIKEACFFVQSGSEELLPWWAVSRNLLIRFPLRILPKPLLGGTMAIVRRC